MGIGTGDNAKPIGVYSQALLQGHTLEQYRANETRIWLRRHIKADQLITNDIVYRLLLESAQFIRGHTRFVIALRSTLVLHDFSKGFETLT